MDSFRELQELMVWVRILMQLLGSPCMQSISVQEAQLVTTKGSWNETHSNGTEKQKVGNCSSILVFPKFYCFWKLFSLNDQVNLWWSLFCNCCLGQNKIFLSMGQLVWRLTMKSFDRLQAKEKNCGFFVFLFFEAAKIFALNFSSQFCFSHPPSPPSVSDFSIILRINNFLVNCCSVCGCDVLVWVWVMKAVGDEFS